MSIAISYETEGQQKEQRGAWIPKKQKKDPIFIESFTFELIKLSQLIRILSSWSKRAFSSEYHLPCI